MKSGGVGGIRTHDPTFTEYTISNRAPSTTRTPLRALGIMADCDTPVESSLLGKATTRGDHSRI